MTRSSPRPAFRPTVMTSVCSRRKSVVAPARLHARLGFLLKREGRVPGDAAFRKEIDDVKRPRHGGFYPMDSSSLHVSFSSVALTTFTNASPSAPSMSRWSNVSAT